MGGCGPGCWVGRSSQSQKSSSLMAASMQSSFLLSLVKVALAGKGKSFFVLFIPNNLKLQLITFSIISPIIHQLVMFKLTSWPRQMRTALRLLLVCMGLSLPLLLKQKQMSEEQHEQLYLALRKLISPPNPIIDKQVSEEPPSPLQPPPQQYIVSDDEEEEDETKTDLYTLAGAYHRKDMVFDKWPNRVNQRKDTVFFASNFMERGGRQGLQYGGQMAEGGLQFNSNYEGGNLLAAYRVAEQEYDLILQNDLNSGGYTQWFHFTVANATHRGTFKLNIVNFYKKQALFREGLKPLSKSLVYEKSWKRGCHSVQYFSSQLLMEGRKGKHYRVLSFKYDFIFEDDTVQFCYCLPYTYTQLSEFITSASSSRKLRVKYLGATPLRNVMPMLQISAEGERERKAVVFMARQHPGETPASHILQAIIEDLLAATQESELLLERYNFYIFPMVNIDGVVLGNYRCNFHGFDLNRNWHLDDSKKHPQIAYVKNELKRIMRKQQIELLIDFHGHSAKQFDIIYRMNSFFYGNSFGKHNMLFPAVSARMDPFIDLSDCSFADEEAQKSNTARVVLGSLIKDTGSAYTFEVSLFGGVRNGKKVAFGSEHYQNLGKSLLGGLYKLGLQLHKEDRLLKESVYLRQLRKEIKRFQSRIKNKIDPASDEQARKTSQIEEKIKVSPTKMAKRQSVEQKDRNGQQETATVEQHTQTYYEFMIEDYRSYMPSIQNERKLPLPLPEERKKKLSFSIRKVIGDQVSRKNQLMSKLRVFGQTFATQAPYSELTRLTRSSQTALTCKIRQPDKEIILNFDRQANRSTFITASFMGRRLGEPSMRRKQRIYKSNSTKVTQADVSFGDLIRHNKMSLC